MKFYPSSKQWKKWTLPSRFSFLAAFMSIIALVLSIATYLLQPSVSTEIEKKIQELDDIKGALTTLSTYVDKQQGTLRKLSTEKVTLEKERDRIQKVLDIDKERLDALLQYQLAQDKGRAWIEIVISFFIGVLSSSAVTFTAIALQNKLKNRKALNTQT